MRAAVRELGCIVSVDGEQAVDVECLAFVGEQGAPAVAGYPGCGLPTRWFEVCKLTCGS